MLDFTVDSSRCTRCGLCVKDCPAKIIQQDGDGLPCIAPDQEALCYQCQHCLAVCPAAAVSILGRKPADSLPLVAGSLPSLEQAERYVRGRRTVRQYRNVDVDPAMVKRLVTTLANAPTGVNRRELTFTVIDRGAVMQAFREKVYRAISDAAASGRVTGPLADAAAAYWKDGADRVFRGAPHALIVSAPPDAPCFQEDVVLTLGYFELLAQSAGLGTVWWGLLKRVLETLPELKTAAGLPADHAYYGMLFGVPAVQYARTVQRDDAAAVRRLEF